MGPDNATEISAVAPSSAAHDRERQLFRSRETSRTPSSMRSNITSSSVMGCVNAFSPDAAEAEVTCRCVDLLGMARRRPIASAVVRRAQVRAALNDLARDPDVRRGRVVAAVLAPAARVLRDAFGASPSCFCEYQSAVHSQTLPIMS